MQKSSLVVAFLVMNLLLALVSPAETRAALSFSDPAFSKTWNRVDKPVETIPGVGRGYTWGPVAPGADQTQAEAYNSGARKVQYFDKARMEINNPLGNANDLFYVTTGLLVKELVSGQRQEGDNTFTTLSPSQVQVAGDPNNQGGNQNAPTYASFNKIATIVGNQNGVAAQLGALINYRINRSGATSTFTPVENRFIGAYDSVTRHNIADVFVNFGNINGQIWDGSAMKIDSVFFGNPTYVLGRPITEPYWTVAVVNKVEKPVLVQLFERRALTYTPDNPAGFKVEMGNVGQHYYRWRYIENGTVNPPVTTTIPVTTPAPDPTTNISQKTGIDLITDLYSLPKLGPYTQSREVSSHDPKGGNIDQGNYLYKEDSRYFIFDDLGPGTIYRIWKTSDTKDGNRLQFFFDGSATPQLDVLVADFFAGKVAPFYPPMVGNDQISSGGFFSYIPFSYAKRLRIATTQVPTYYQIDYQHYQKGVMVNSFNGKENYDKLYNFYKNPGTDPKPATANRKVIRGQGTVGRKSELDLTNAINGPGVITGIKLSTTSNSNLFLVSNAIRVRYDSKTTPNIEAPLDFFFGSGLGEKGVSGLLSGIDPVTHQYYFYLPMPFRQNANIALANYTGNTFNISWEVTYEPDTSGTLVTADTGYLNTYSHEVKEPAKTLDYNVLKIKGQGKYVGSVVRYSSIKSSMEGDSRFYLDESSTPWWPGTGFEDYFNGAWGFSGGAFSRLLHGSAYVDNPPGDNTWITLTGYRFHVGDAINFYNAISLGFEHGYIGTNTWVEGEKYSSLAFWYGQDGQALQLTDALDLSDNTGSIRNHNYSNNGVVNNATISTSFEGENDHAVLAGSGYEINNSSQFGVTINPDNNGVVLRRRFDYNNINQQADIYIDGQYTGRWFSPGQNQTKRWREEDFYIPAQYTRGKSNLQVQVKVIVEPSPWTEYFYWIYSVHN